MSQLSESVNELTRDHQIDLNKGNGPIRLVTEYSLLYQLREAFTANRGSGPGSGGAKGLISFNALNLWQEIAEVTTEHWRGRGRPALQRTPLAERIQDWYEQSKDTFHEPECAAWVTKWCRQIRALDESRCDVIGRCPACGEHEVAIDDDGETIWKTAVTRVESKVYASCAHCLTEWDGLDAMRDLANHLVPVGD